MVKVAARQTAGWLTSNADWNGSGYCGIALGWPMLKFTADQMQLGHPVTSRVIQCMAEMTHHMARAFLNPAMQSICHDLFFKGVVEAGAISPAKDL
jgi:hypothetical protein